MPVEHIPWVIPAAEHAYKHREDIAKLWAKISAILLGKKSKIAITGMPAVGKSVLLEHLTGEAYKRNYQRPPQPSPRKETGRVYAPRKRIRLTTIPGQARDERYVALDEVFESKEPVTGIIHVVANGFASTRNQAAQKALIANNIKTVEDYRTFKLAQEIDDLKATCESIIRSNRKHRKAMWMLVAANKCDLFTDNLAEVEAYYSPYGENNFTKELKLLEQKIGSLYFSWDAVPVCSMLENFEWNGNSVPSKLQIPQRDQLITELLRRIESAG